MPDLRIQRLKTPVQNNDIKSSAGLSFSRKPRNNNAAATILESTNNVTRAMTSITGLSNHSSSQSPDVTSSLMDDYDNVTEAMKFDGEYQPLAWSWQMIVGVSCGGVVILIIVVTALILFCYQCQRRWCSTCSPHDAFRYQTNSPQIWEDTVTLSYINAQFDLKDNSEEFASLENDTFLNSLESMMFVNSYQNNANTTANTKL